MFRDFILFCFVFSVATPCSKAEDGLLNVVSPKLRQFLAGHPEAEKSLKDAIAESPDFERAHLYYFYSEDESQPRGSFQSPSKAVVIFVIRENQRPADEYVSLLSCIINTHGMEKFEKLEEQAKSGGISKSEFVIEMRRQEHQAALKVRNILSGLELSDKEKTATYYFEVLANCPDSFEAYLNYQPEGVTRDRTKELEARYDFYRGTP